MPVTFDIITPDGVAVDIHDAVANIMCPEFIGRLVELLVLSGVISGRDLADLLPQDYKVRPL